MKKNKNLKIIILLFVWSLLLVTIPFLVSMAMSNRYKNNGAYISSEFDIKNYDVIMEVDKNNKVDVTETITIDIPGNNFKGIYKSIPLWLKYYSANGKIKTKKIEITNLRAEGEKFVTNKNSDNVSIKIGSEKTTTTSGLHTYKIMYRYDMGKDDNKDYDELIFNLFDNYDNTKIENLSLTINMPTDIIEENINFFNGNENINSKIDYSITGKTLKANITNYQLDKAITLNMSLKEGYFVGQTDNYGVVCFIVCLALIILSIYSFISWIKYGKDFAKYTQTVEFYPPDNLDAAQVGYIYGERSITKLTTALIISLASKNYIAIEEVEKNKYKIKNIGKNNPNKLSITEQIVYQDLFLNNDEVILSDNLTFAKTFAKVNACLENVLDKKINDLEARKKMYITFALLFVGIVLLVSSCLYIRDLNPNYNIMYLLSFVSIFISGFLAIFTGRKTSYGEMIIAKVSGFRDYLDKVEKDKLNTLVEENPNYFYDILPYTYVLNISKKWIDTFEKKNIPNMDLSALDTYENSLFMIMSE